VSRFITLCLYLLLLLVSLGAAAFAAFDYARATRGIESDFPAAQKIIGTNVALEQYASDAELQRAFDELKRLGVTHARQYFSWRDIEVTRGEYDWTKWDRLVDAARANGIQLVAVLHTAPAWSQREHERAMPGAPANDFAEYARFAGDFAKRYGDKIDYYQIWDEPNVEPNWGKRNADATEYAQMLIPASQAIRANDADAKILAAGLAMNLEVHRPHPNYSEILFLRGLYEIGARNYFDMVAAKPYGMWTGPEDRTVNSDTLNFSRLILLREEMRHYGDKQKPLWAVEMGWNALPPNWTGDLSPWGTDTEEKQSGRLARGLARMQNEWAWVTGAFPNDLQPNVDANNPRWGFAMLAQDGTPRLFYETLAQFIASPPAPGSQNNALVLPIALLLGAAGIAAWRAWHWAFVLRAGEHWRTLKTRVHAIPELGQFGIVLAVAAAFYFSPNAALNFVLLGALIFLFALRLDFAFALIIFSVPFWNYPKTLFGGFELSPVEALTWATAAAFVLNEILEYRFSRAQKLLTIFGLQSQVSFFDWLALAFFILGAASVFWAGNFGVASREFRIMVLDPLLLYAMLRMTNVASSVNASGFREKSRFGANEISHAVRNDNHRFVWALLASAVAVCVIGLYQFFTGNVILADGVARLTAVWGSPNNVALYVGRLLPIALAFALLWREGGGDHKGSPLRNTRFVYAALVILFGATILLTYSRGALLLGVPASVLFVLIAAYLQGHRLSRRAWLVIGAVLLVSALALLWFVTTERFQSLFQTGTGTGFFRVAVWTSAVNMIRDHPLLGVGLDNFLYEYPKYMLPDAWREPNLSHPHNFILDFWTRLGIFGVAILLALLVLFYRRAWHSFKTTPDLYARALMLGLMASMVNFLAHGLIDAAYFYVDLAYVFWLTIFLVQDPKGFLDTFADSSRVL
jgi:O-antigen ligase